MFSQFDLTNVSAAAQKDITELQNRINAYLLGQEDAERFRHYRLTRGVYGQRQVGVQMYRTKIPFGKLTARQLERIAQVSEKYTNGNLHLTTRQNIQLHYIKLTDAPAVSAELEQVAVTAREACGNTVRNITGSAKAGIDPQEPFDISPYAHAAFTYFLRNPICQDMGRKVKIAFSSGESDSAYTYFHDFGFIPRIENLHGQQGRGFKVVIGGGLGAQSMVAQTAYEFLETDKIIPFLEGALRVFDRYGEREKRMKARLKFLIQKVGLPHFLELVEQEQIALKNHSVPVAVIPDELPALPPPPDAHLPPHLEEITQTRPYQLWLSTNVFEQKQPGYYGIHIRVPLGNLHALQAYAIAQMVSDYAHNDLRITVNQGLLLRFVPQNALPWVYYRLQQINLAQPGFDTIVDITACPGTDTCALGVTNSTGLAAQLEEVIKEEYPELLTETGIKIKISGCMNSCGQHMAANIGFHGSSIKKNALVIPAMQIVLGGGVDVEGKGFIAEKIVKIPTKRVPDALRILLNDYEQHGNNTYFNDYFYQQGKNYFYNLLKPLADIATTNDGITFDWGQNTPYVQEIGVGECAGVSLDVVGAIINDAQEKITLAQDALAQDALADSIYHSYTAFVIGAKALLLSKEVHCNTHAGIISDFQTHYVNTGEFTLPNNNFEELALQINRHEPSAQFAKQYLHHAAGFVNAAINTRTQQLALANGQDKLVIDNYYKA